MAILTETPGESSDVPKSVPSGDLGDSIYLREARRATQNVLQLSGGSTTQPVLKNRKPFDLQFFESLLEHPDCRELSPEHWLQIGRLYASQEVDPDIFGTLAGGNESEAERMLVNGGFIDEWAPSPEVRERLRSINPMYKPSGEEFLEFLEGKHGREADFRAWGLFDKDGEIEAIASAFLPPHNAMRKQQHGQEVKIFFEGQHPTIRFLPSMSSWDRIAEYVCTADTTAEFYLIAAHTHGGSATVVLDHMFQAIDYNYDITDWYLLRFGSLDTVPLPGEEAFHAPDADNAVSKNFFKQRGFSTCGECRFESADADGKKFRQVAGRKTRDSSIVVVQPTWNVMRATAESFRDANNAHLLYLKGQAAARRQQV